MGFLSNLFGSENNEQAQFWNTVSEPSDIDAIVMQSMERPQVILKHSNQCATSFFAKKNLELIPLEDLENADLYIIDVIRQRPLSRYLEQKVQVRHESPQLLVLMNGEVAWHGSHHQVQSEYLLQTLQEV
ncbi:MAG: bacillithiol system redox-active protein YtxJ [Balneolaceae bacterium]|nr:bacillithiol system redox-active protein YtxJ [Balneolaceae bacterium]